MYFNQRVLIIEDTVFMAFNGDRRPIFAWSFEPREDLAICRAEAVPSAFKCSTDWASPSAVTLHLFRFLKNFTS